MEMQYVVYGSHVPMDNMKNIKTPKKKVFRFLDKYLEMPEFQGWLQRTPKKRGDNDIALCKICDSNIVAKKSELLKHKKSKKHKKNEAKMGLDITSQSPVTEDVKNAEINLYAFMAEHNLPVQVSDCLVPLCRNIFPDSDIATHIASKDTTTMQISTSDLENNRDLDVLHMKLKVPGMFFSIYMDETIDESAIKQNTLTVVYMDGEKGVRYSFFDMFKLKLYSSKNMYIYFKNSMLSKGIPFENLVGFSSDTTNCSVEDNNNSVFFHLHKECPDIPCIRCPCHMIQHAVAKACLKIPPLVEEFLKNLGAYFSNSYGKHQSFTDFQQFFHVDIHEILTPGITSWLSTKECVEQVLGQYDPVLLYIQQTCTDEPCHNSLQTVLDTMNNLFTKAYVQFMSYAHGMLDDFNATFQAERPLLHKIKPEVEKLLKVICLNFLQTDYVKKNDAFKMECCDSRYYLPLDEIYLGVLASETINDLKQMPDVDKKEIEFFFESILDFYVELVRVVREEFDFSDELYNVISVVDPQVAQDFNIKSLAGVWKRFPLLKKFTNMQTLDNEWKKHALLDHQLEGLDPGMHADEYWRKVFKIKRGVFSNLYIVIKLLLSLPCFPAQLLKRSLAR